MEEVEKFAQELAEATDACAKAQRVLLERQTREASGASRRRRLRARGARPERGVRGSRR